MDTKYPRRTAGAMMNRADAVQSLIQRAPGLIRQARLGDQNASSVLRTIGEMARMGHPGAKAVAMAIANHIEGERVGFGGHAGHKMMPAKARKAKQGAV